MNPSTLSLLLLLAEGLWAVPGWRVQYPESICVVKGSTTIIPCSFIYPKDHTVRRLVWCPNHTICQGNTFSVYDSNITASSRFIYLGDRAGNCTLKITETRKQETATYRFRIETNHDQFTDQRGVYITVTDGDDVMVQSSISGNTVNKSSEVTLTCTSVCSFHQLDVHWYRNGQALSEKGPALHLHQLTYQDTGNYTCSLDSSRQKMSAPWTLVVLDDGDQTAETKPNQGQKVVVVVTGLLLAVSCLLVAGFVFAKRKHGRKKEPEVILKQEVANKQEASEDVSYSTIHFQHNPPRSARGHEDETIYHEVSLSTTVKH